MPAKDIASIVRQQVAFNVQSVSSNTTTNGVEIDTQGFESVVFIPFSGARTDGTYTPLIQDTDTSGSGYADVIDDFLIGTEAGSAISAANTATKIGYNGKKRYVRLSLVSTSVTTGATVGGIVVLETARHNPVA